MQLLLDIHTDSESHKQDVTPGFSTASHHILEDSHNQSFQKLQLADGHLLAIQVIVNISLFCHKTPGSYNGLTGLS